MPYRPTQKTEARKSLMRRRLIEAGRKLFVEQGYETTTLQQIVREAGTSIGNCYFYFASKEALLLTVAEEFRTEIARKVDQAIEPLPLGPGLFAVAIYAGVLAVLEQPELARVTLSDATHPSLRSMTMELFASRVERAFQNMPDLFLEWPEATPRLAALAWHGAVNYILEEMIRGRNQEEPERVALFLVRWNLQALGLSEKILKEALETVENYRKHL